MRLLRRMDFQEQLLPTSDAARGMEGTELVASNQSSLDAEAAGSRRSAAPQVKVMGGRCSDYVISALLLVAIAVPSITVIGVVATQWQSNPSQRGWLILGFGFYIVAGLRHCWSLLMKRCEQILYLRIEVRRFAASTLFQAITDAVAAEAEEAGGTCSFDQEAVHEHDRLTGRILVKLKFWSSQARTIEVAIGDRSGEQGHSCEQLKVQVHFQPGEDVVVGRDSRLERREILVISARTSPSQVLEHKKLLIRWMEAAHNNFVKPAKDAVDVYALQESSADWVPEWKFERTRELKCETSQGESFFLERDGYMKVLADAKLWPRSALRVYMVTGPPGVGKSEFTIWLAGQLGLPLYRLSLTNSRLTDERLAQLLSQSSITFNAVLVQIDEFQETVDRWEKRADSSVGVSPGGFCEVLQGATAMSQGVVILTGTGKLLADTVLRQYPAVHRRIQCTAELSWMTKEDIARFFRNFLQRFVPGLTDPEWVRREVQFVACRCWSGKWNISVDMLKQYLMRTITQSSYDKLGELIEDRAAPGVTLFQVIPEHLEAFFKLVLDEGSAVAFLETYAPVESLLGAQAGQASDLDEQSIA